MLCVHPSDPLEPMRTRALSLILLALVPALPAAASAKPTLGVSDNRPTMLADPLFTALGVKQVRVVVSYNAVTAGENGDDEISGRVAPYIAAASFLGIDPLVAFEHSRGNAAVVCAHGKGRSKAVCKLPSVASYKAEIMKFLTKFPTVHTITPWNEENHFSQATYRDPARGAQFAKAAEQVCKSLGRTCTIPTMDILDSASNTKSSHPRYTSTVKYVKRLRKAYGRQPAVCGIHNYADVNRFRTSGTKALTKAMRCKSYWLTETGGDYAFGSFWNKDTKKVGKCKTSAGCQKKAMQFLFKRVIKVTSKIKRVYVYNWFGGSEPRFDAGIVKGSGNAPSSKARPAYGVVKAHAPGA